MNLFDYLKTNRKSLNVLGIEKGSGCPDTMLSKYLAGNLILTAKNQKKVKDYINKTLANKIE